DAVVVLSLVQAAVLGLVSEDELFGATISAEAFHPELQPDLSGAPMGESGPPGLDVYQLSCNGRALKEPSEEEMLEIKFEKVEEEEEKEVNEVSVPGDDKDPVQAEAPQAGAGCEALVQSSAVKMIDLSAFSRKSRTLRHLPRTPRPELNVTSFNPPFPDPANDGFPEPTMALPGPEALPTECGFEPPHQAPLNDPKHPSMASPEPVKPEQGFVWQESGAFEGDTVGSTVESNKKAQLDRLDINVEIEDSYLVKTLAVPHVRETHMVPHQGTRLHKCQVCHKAFTQTSHLKCHILLHSEVKPYSCHFCGCDFAHPSELKAHEVKHERSRCHICVKCGLEFSILTQLKRHLVSHQGPTLYQYLKCDKSLHYCSQLQNHMNHHILIHTSVRPYQRHICFKTCVQKQTLKTHMIVHSPVVQFKCKVCGKSFNCYNLLGHMHLHTGSKPFKCTYCSSKFNLKGNLSRHMKVKHGVMNISLDSQDPMMKVAGPDPSELDSQQELEDLENAFPYTSINSNAEASVLTEQAAKEMAYYSML
uniref:C2H2-type domain-containing protein n=1 Tax=Jaculus jaculus TaxID=51337 RepID=A0A8C5P4L4_JACJA